MNEIKHPDRRETSGSPYSAGIECDGWLYVSGQGPIDWTTTSIVGDTIGEQTQVTMQNLEAVLIAGGCTLHDVVKCTCYLDDMAEFDEFSRVYSSFFPGIKPARTTTQAKLWGNMKVEIDAIARVPSMEQTP